MLFSSIAAPVLLVSPFSALEVQVETKSLVQGEVDHSLPCTSLLVFLRLSGEVCSEEGPGRFTGRYICLQPSTKAAST